MLIFNQSQSWKASPPSYNAVYRAVTGIVAGKLLGVIQLLILTEMQQGMSVLCFISFVESHMMSCKQVHVISYRSIVTHRYTSLNH